MDGKKAYGDYCRTEWSLRISQREEMRASGGWAYAGKEAIDQFRDAEGGVLRTQNAEKAFRSEHPLEHTLADLEINRDDAIQAIAKKEMAEERGEKRYDTVGITLSDDQQPEYFEEIERYFGPGTIEMEEI